MSGRRNVDKGDRSDSRQLRLATTTGPYTMSTSKAQRQQLLVAKQRIFKADSAVPSQTCWFKISECLSQKYDPTNKALDLKAVRINKELEARGVDLVLNRKDHMDGLNKIIRENMPMITSLNLTCNDLHRLDNLAELAQHTPSLKKLNLSKNNLKAVRELYQLKVFNLEELWLKGNPLCNSFRNPNAYIRMGRCFRSCARLRLQCPLHLRCPPRLWWCTASREQASATDRWRSRRTSHAFSYQPFPPQPLYIVIDCFYPDGGRENKKNNNYF
ncbi:unnamed protein product [Lampetra planeri]